MFGTGVSLLIIGLRLDRNQLLKPNHRYINAFEPSTGKLLGKYIVVFHDEAAFVQILEISSINEIEDQHSHKKINMTSIGDSQHDQIKADLSEIGLWSDEHFGIWHILFI